MKTSAKKVTYKNILHFEVLGGRNQIWRTFSNVIFSSVNIYHCHRFRFQLSAFRKSEKSFSLLNRQATCGTFSLLVGVVLLIRPGFSIIYTVTLSHACVHFCYITSPWGGFFCLILRNIEDFFPRFCSRNRWFLPQVLSVLETLTCSKRVIIKQ